MWLGSTLRALARELDGWVAVFTEYTGVGCLALLTRQLATSPKRRQQMALVFAITASGNVAPKRILRNAPAGSPTVGFGNPGAVAYDSKRDEILVPN